MMGLFPQISMATVTTFPGTSLIVKKDKLGSIGEKILFRRHALPKHPRFNISVKHYLPLPDKQIGVFEPPIQCDYA